MSARECADDIVDPPARHPKPCRMTVTPAPDTASPAKRAAIAIVITVAATVAVMLLLGERAYLWVKAVHVIAIISWMAGMLYLPRLFIYHCDAEGLGAVRDVQGDGAALAQASSSIRR